MSTLVPYPTLRRSAAPAAGHAHLRCVHPPAGGSGAADRLDQRLAAHAGRHRPCPPEPRPAGFHGPPDRAAIAAATYGGGAVGGGHQLLCPWPLAPSEGRAGEDRKSVVWGKSGSVRVDLGGRRIIKKKQKHIQPM